MDNRIAFKFHPFDFENKNHSVEKNEGGKQRRYLCGISSGIRPDHHGERMTEKCIKSFMDQANNGDILLYTDKHDVEFTGDIGILTKSEIKDNGDWYTEYRLYDEDDGVDTASLEKANKLWKQVNGIKPYTKPKQKGFSIEGHVPEGGIVEMSSAGQRVLDNVELDGTVVVPRPAYKDSIAHSVYKALGMETPWILRSDFGKELQNRLMKDYHRDTFHKKQYQLEDALSNLIEEIMITKDCNEREERLQSAFKEYSNIMIPLIMENQLYFQSVDKAAKSMASPYSFDAEAHKQQLFKSLQAQLGKLKKLQKQIRRK